MIDMAGYRAEVPYLLANAHASARSCRSVPASGILTAGRRQRAGSAAVELRTALCREPERA